MKLVLLYCLVASAVVFSLLLAGAVEASPSNSAQVFDVLIKGGTVYDGSGAEGRVGRRCYSRGSHCRRRQFRELAGEASN